MYSSDCIPPWFPRFQTARHLLTHPVSQPASAKYHTEHLLCKAYQETWLAKTTAVLSNPPTSIVSPGAYLLTCPNNRDHLGNLEMLCVCVTCVTLVYEVGYFQRRLTF